MPAKLIKKLIEEYKQTDDYKLYLNDKGLVDILEIPELGNYFYSNNFLRGHMHSLTQSVLLNNKENN